MSDQLLKTKLSIPLVRRDSVSRPRLIDQLNTGLWQENGFARKLTLVSTPAGYGKTMLLSAWANQCSFPVTWISLDEADNDLTRFLSYLVGALEKVEPGVGKNLLALLQSPHLPPADKLLSDLINEITQFEAPFVLILDDYHLISEQAIHDALIYLLDHLPPQMHMVIVSRADPPLRLARLRARSELIELRLDDLRFTYDEAAQFLTIVMGLDLDDDNISNLTERTEGWIAGLQMAAISMRGLENKANFIQLFSGSNRYILDYLAEEVLKSQTEDIQSFLLQTSILDRLCGPVCEAVTGRSNGQEILERLEQSNLFIIPLDEERGWYRYHQLFVDLLCKRLQQSVRGGTAVFNRRASEWFETNGYLEEAIEHALTARDYDRAAELVESMAQPMLMRSEIKTVSGWVNRLPDDVVLSRPDLILYRAWLLAVSGSPVEAVENWLDRVEVSSESIASKVSVIRGYLKFSQGEIFYASKMIQQALQGLPAGENLFRGVATWLLSLTYVTMGDFETGARALEEIVQTSLQKRNFLITAGALCQLAEVHLRLAQLPEAKDDYERVLSIARDSRGRRLPVACRALMGLGELYREWNDLDLAAQYCVEGIELARGMHKRTSLGGYITLAFIRQAQGDIQGADEALQIARDIALETEETSADDLQVMFYRAHLHLLQGNLHAVESWMHERGIVVDLNPADLDQKDDFIKYHLLKYEYLVVAGWLVASDKLQEALTLLDMLQSKMEEQGRIRLLIEAFLLSALAHQKVGDTIQAYHCFKRCLALAEPGGYQRLFLDAGPPLEPLLRGAIRQKDYPEYAHTLLAAFEREGRKVKEEKPIWQSRVPPSSGLIEPLTERELELLILIGEGLSNHEIAQRLFISLPTVKWHTSNIYSKLGVQSRTHAVAKARSLGLLPAN